MKNHETYDETFNGWDSQSPYPGCDLIAMIRRGKTPRETLISLAVLAFGCFRVTAEGIVAEEYLRSQGVTK